MFIYLFLMNVVAFAMMGIDKNRARKGQYRISEQTLWIAALLGGGIGGVFGMNFFRHKTKHASFKFGLPFIAVLQTVGYLYWYIEG